MKKRKEFVLNFLFFFKKRLDKDKELGAWILKNYRSFSEMIPSLIDKIMRQIFIKKNHKKTVPNWLDNLDYDCQPVF